MRVLVTRPQAQAAATARRLRELGHEAMLAPVLEIVPTGEPAPEGTFDALLLTSANAVPAAATERVRFGSAPVLAVGSRTAAAARESGYGMVTQAGGDSPALVTLVRQMVPAGARLLHAAGQDRKAEPARSLAAAGYSVEIWECYRAAPVPALPQETLQALASGQVGTVLHFSRRSAEVFAGLVRLAALGEALAGTSHLCLSSDVAHGLGDLTGLKVRIAREPDEASLLALIVETTAAPGSRLPQSRC